MAKPIPAGRRAGCSTSSTSYTKSENIHHHRSPRRHRRRPPFSWGPSPAILSLLATISASTSAHASPAPPAFLCPSLEAQPCPPPPSVHSRGITPSEVRRPPRLVKTIAGNTRHVPDKFVMDDDGRWRRVETYTLYGSTVCLTCHDSTTSVTSVDDQIQGPASSAIPQPTPSSTTSFDIHDSLPKGWKLPGGSSASRSTLILALSLVLAFIICFLIIGCLFWRKSRHRKRKKDIEMKVRRQISQPGNDDARVSMLIVEREVKVKQKIWARATARWKANARYAARQRRGKRTSLITRTNSPESSRASLDRIEATQSVSQVPASSPTASRRSSRESLYPNTTRDTSLTTPLPPEQALSSEIPISSLSSRPPSPPAYRLRVTVAAACASPECQRTDRGDNRPSPLPHGSPYPPSSYLRSIDTAGNSDSLSSRTVHAAHVATDDKNLLAQLADLASAPPADGTAPHANTFTLNVSVPTWQDEELEDFGEESHGLSNFNLHPSRHTSRSSSPSPLFPPPPSKGKMAASSFYDYAFEDAPAESDPGPSAPPFEEESCCPLNVTELSPSAPPLSHMEAPYYIRPYDSAQYWERFVSSEPYEGGQVRPLQDQGQGRVLDDGAESFMDHSLPLVHGPIARDGTPPSYQT